MNLRVSDAVNALRWGLRRYAWLFVLCLLAISAVIPLLVAQGRTAYEATALVVAQRLDMDLAALPRFAEETFDNGEVATAVAATFSDGGNFDNIIPNRVALVAEQDSIVLQVVAVELSAETAAATANLAAAAFALQLNRPGEGVGAFSVLSEALPPSEPVEQVASAPLALSVGLGAGVITGLAAVSLVLVIRRPVIDAVDAAAVTGVAVLGTVTIPRLKAPHFPSAANVEGLVPVCRRLLAMRPRAILLMAAGGADSSRGQLSVAMASVLGRVRAVNFVTAPAIDPDTGEYTSDDTPFVADVDPSETAERSHQITLVDGPHPLDVAAPGQSSVAVLAFTQGVSERALRSAVAEQLGGLGTDRLLLLRRRSRVRTPRHQRVPSEPAITQRHPALVADR